jgi:ribulose-phosphate 3-epimerase
MIKIAPSILTADLSNLEKQIRFLENGNADFIHIDIMDGHFVPNITFGTLMVETIKKLTNIPLDVHLMISEPQKHIESFIKAGANYLTIHQEADIHLDRAINLIRESGAKPGVSINPSTPIDTLENILDAVEMVLIMSVNPGFGGQKFIPNSLNKISRLKKLVTERNLDILIEVDGGVNNSNVKDLVKSGVNVLVIGNSIFSTPDIAETTKKFKSLANENYN